MKIIQSTLLLFLTAACTRIPLTHPVKTSTPSKISANETAQARKLIPVNATWQIQYSGEMDYSLDVDVYNIELFETDPADIAKLHERGIFVMCYFSAGSYEDWRPDANRFPSEILGNELDGWEGESWLDIRQLAALKPIMESRLDLALQKGCDGVDPDNVDGYQNDTGFPLTSNDQAAYNIFLASQAHARGLSIGLKNDLEQIPDLVSFFDWALSEQCFQYKECRFLQSFIEAGKPVFVIEYHLTPEEFCFQSRTMQFSALQKNLELDAFRFSCN